MNEALDVWCYGRVNVGYFLPIPYISFHLVEVHEARFEVQFNSGKSIGG